MDVKVIDNEGSWFVNRSQFRFHDPESGVNFEPSVPTKVKPTKWMEGQSEVIQAIEDPFNDKPAVITGEQILRENPDNLAGNANAANGGAAAAAAAAAAAKKK